MTSSKRTLLEMDENRSVTSPMQSNAIPMECEKESAEDETSKFSPITCKTEPVDNSTTEISLTCSESIPLECDVKVEVVQEDEEPVEESMECTVEIVDDAEISHSSNSTEFTSVPPPFLNSGVVVTKGLPTQTTNSGPIVYVVVGPPDVPTYNDDDIEIIPNSEQFHAKKPEHEYKCEECGVKYGEMSELVMHWGTHVKKYECTHCGIRFPLRENLENHVKSHVSRINHKQKQKKYNKDKRLRYFNGHECGHCELRFVGFHTLARHLEKVHNKVPIKRLMKHGRLTGKEDPDWKGNKSSLGRNNEPTQLHENKNVTSCIERSHNLRNRTNSKAGDSAYGPDEGDRPVRDLARKRDVVRAKRGRPSKEFEFEKATDNLLRCLHCSVAFRKKSQMAEHMQIHAYEIECKSYVDEVRSANICEAARRANRMKIHANEIERKSYLKELKSANIRKAARRRITKLEFETISDEEDEEEEDEDEENKESYVDDQNMEDGHFLSHLIGNFPTEFTDPSDTDTISDPEIAVAENSNPNAVENYRGQHSSVIDVNSVDEIAVVNTKVAPTVLESSSKQQKESGEEEHATEKMPIACSNDSLSSKSIRTNIKQEEHSNIETAITNANAPNIDPTAKNRMQDDSIPIEHSTDENQPDDSLSTESGPSNTSKDCIPNRDNRNSDVLQCVECSVTFSSVLDLTEHLKEHKPVRVNRNLFVLKCVECSVAFSSVIDMTEHWKEHIRNVPHKCDRCESRFPFLASLKKHSKLHVHSCQECGLVFGNHEFYSEHIRSHHPKSS